MARDVVCQRQRKRVYFGLCTSSVAVRLFYFTAA